ncbi:hypothetical protein BDV26DRAFT_261492, partial [Aspergillus bertholletiae]
IGGVFFFFFFGRIGSGRGWSWLFLGLGLVWFCWYSSESLWKVDINKYSGNFNKQ